MPLGPPPDDPVSRRLIEHWFRPEPVPLFESHSAGMLAGYCVTVGGSELVYRVDDDDPATVLIVLYRRPVASRATSGLANPFAGLLAFVEFLIRNGDLGVTRLMGRVDADPYRGDHGLPTHRLLRYYVECHGVGRTRFDGSDWVCLDLKDYRRPRDRRRALRAADDDDGS